MEVAESLASAHPAEAERVFQLVDDSSEACGYDRKDVIALRLCTRMAKTDPERARRLIAGLKNPREQACGWALLAFVLADRDKPAARSALAESIRLIDRLEGPPDAAELATFAPGDLRRTSIPPRRFSRSSKKWHRNAWRRSSGRRSPSCRKTTPSSRGRSSWHVMIARWPTCSSRRL